MNSIQLLIVSISLSSWCWFALWYKNLSRFFIPGYYWNNCYTWWDLTSLSTDEVINKADITKLVCIELICFK
jgi:hypothetical protein